jgi:hypothetical protein
MGANTLYKVENPGAGPRGISLRGTAGNPNMRKLFISLFTLVLVFTLACNIVTTPVVDSSPYKYDDLPEGEVNESGFSKYRAISEWDKLDITYAFINGTNDIPGDREWQDVRDGFAIWAEQTPLTFTEASDSSQADIVIGWARGDHGDGDPFDGPGDVLAHASYPNPYQPEQVILHFDEDEDWVDGPNEDVDLVTVAAHEIGHTLGLDHSRDPNSLMFPSYSGPHRFLDNDDIAGVQSLYGLRADAPAPPETPQPSEAPPSSTDADADGDGLADTTEVLKTGTDPRSPDSDQDGIPDGIEVQNRMNPLDPDMDKDGVSDGAEIAAGTDPFLPEEGISSDLADQVGEFLTQAIDLQIEAFRQNDASIAAQVMAGAALQETQNAIASLSQQGLVELSEIDYYQSYINDIRVVDNQHLEVDTCEVWSTEVYRESGEFVQSTDPELLPQTITLQKLNEGWFITNVKFFDAPAFCQ